MAEPPNAAQKLPFDIPAPVRGRSAEMEVVRPAGCHLDRAFRDQCPAVAMGLEPECAPCPHWDADWALLDAALTVAAEKKARALVPKKVRASVRGKA